MTEQALRKMIAAGESTRQEFKLWVKTLAGSVLSQSDKNR